MADFKKIVPFILRWEGGKSNIKQDRGGLTNKGITLSTFNELSQKVLGVAPSMQVFNNLTDFQASLFVKHFFDIATGGNKINNEAIAFMLTDWHFNSGRGGLISFQRMLNHNFKTNLLPDGIIGIKTVGAINSLDPKKVYKAGIEWRKAFYNQIVKNDPSQSIFLKGWLNRVNDFVKTYPMPILTTGLIISVILFFL